MNDCFSSIIIIQIHADMNILLAILFCTTFSGEERTSETFVEDSRNIYVLKAFLESPRFVIDMSTHNGELSKHLCKLEYLIYTTETEAKENIDAEAFTHTYNAVYQFCSYIAHVELEKFRDILRQSTLIQNKRIFKDRIRGLRGQLMREKNVDNFKKLQSLHEEIKLSFFQTLQREIKTLKKFENIVGPVDLKIWDSDVNFISVERDFHIACDKIWGEFFCFAKRKIWDMKEFISEYDENSELTSDIRNWMILYREVEPKDFVRAAEHFLDIDKRVQQVEEKIL